MASFEAQHELTPGLAAAEVVGPVGGDDHEVGPRLLSDPIDEVGAGVVDPVQVLDDEHCGAGRHRRRHQVEHSGRQVVACHAGVDEAGHRIQRPALRTRLCGDGDRGDRRRQRRHELAHDAGLADPGLARHQRHGRLLGGHHLCGVDDPGQPGVGARPADHDRAHPDAAAQHDPDVRGSGTLEVRTTLSPAEEAPADGAGGEDLVLGAELLEAVAGDDR